MKVSIIIVHYHVKQRLFDCLQSIISTTENILYEIIVVDNDEKKTIEKELKEKFPLVSYIASEQNGGFGAGNNLGAKAAKGDFLFFLNPDTLILGNCIEKLYNFLQKNKNAAAVAPLLLEKNKKIISLQGAQELTPMRAVFALSFINTLFPKNSISRKYWLLDWKKDTLKNVDVIPGTAFMISSKIFNRIGKFDERFFLYFEENDICRRVRSLGYDIFINPEAKIIHFLGESTKKREDKNDIFKRSRFLYFKKHFGFFAAITVHIFLELKRNTLLTLSIFLLAAFLRFYRLEETFIFSGEVGHNLLAIKNAFFTQEIPLLGPPTSHPWLYFGPLYYWVYGPILIMSGFNPVSHAFFGAVISILTVLANYFVIKKIFNKRVALISSYLISISPLFMNFTRGARFFSIVSFLIYPLLYLLFTITKEKKHYIFFIGLLIGSMFSFHFTPIILIPFIFSIFYVKKIGSIKEVFLRFLFGVIIPMLSFFYYDVSHGFSMTRNILLWIPYRIAGFVGLYPKNTISQKVVGDNVLSLSDFFTKSIINTNSSVLNVIVLIALLSFVLFKISRSIYSKKIIFSEAFVFLWFMWGYVAIFIHGSPPIHYFLPLLPLPIIIFALFLERLWSKRIGKAGVVSILVVLTIINLKYYFSDTWFFLSEKAMSIHPYYVPYTLQQNVAREIVKDAKGEKYKLKRVGLDDQFEEDYAQNYIYLLWLYGNEPEKEAKITYTIYEEPIPKQLEKNMHIQKKKVSNITIVKELQ